MEVDGISVAAAEDIQAASVVEGYIASGTGHLILKTRGGTEIDAGEVVPSPLASWPIGSIFMNTAGTNPNTLLGGGTWVRWGKGRMPVSLDEAQTEFDAAEETGGEKTHVLTEAEMPTHNHSGTAASAGDHTHSYSYKAGDIPGLSQTGAPSNNAWNGVSAAATALSGAHTHTVTTVDKGGNAAHNNLPPYITVYMWKRTA